MSEAVGSGIMPVLRANRRRTGVMSSSSRWTGVSALSSTVGKRRRSGLSAAIRRAAGPANINKPPEIIARAQRATKQSPPGCMAEIASLRSQ